MNILVTSSGREGSARAQEIMRQTVDLIANIEPKPEITPLVGYSDEVVLNYLRENVCNLLIIGAFANRSTGGVHSFGPTAHRLVQEAPVSVLLVKQPTPYCPHCGRPLRWVETLPRRRIICAPPG